MIDILEKLNSMKEDFAATEKRKIFLGGQGCGAIAPVMGEGNADWRTITMVKMLPGGRGCCAIVLPSPLAE